MALDREFELVARHPGTVVGNRDQALPAVAQHDLDPGGAGIDGVFDELLDRRSRALDDLAGGDAVDDNGRQLADLHGPPL